MHSVEAEFVPFEPPYPNPTHAGGNVEVWLLQVEESMRHALRNQCEQATY